jgi:hypothetical protein
MYRDLIAARSLRFPSQYNGHAIGSDRPTMLFFKLQSENCPYKQRWVHRLATGLPRRAMFLRFLREGMWIQGSTAIPADQSQHAGGQCVSFRLTSRERSVSSNQGRILEPGNEFDSGLIPQNLITTLPVCFADLK